MIYWETPVTLSHTCERAITYRTNDEREKESIDLEHDELIIINKLFTINHI